jgi:hypothetical protein
MIPAPRSAVASLRTQLGFVPMLSAICAEDIGVCASETSMSRCTADENLTSFMRIPFFNLLLLQIHLKEKEVFRQAPLGDRGLKVRCRTHAGKAPYPHSSPMKKKAGETSPASRSRSVAESRSQHAVRRLSLSSTV